MVALGPGSVVVVAFPFSDLSGSKLRPAAILAEAGRGDWILCQITSNPYQDSQALRLTSEDFRVGALAKVSFARPNKLFTAHDSLIQKQVAILTPKSLAALLGSTIRMLQASVPK